MKSLCLCFSSLISFSRQGLTNYLNDLQYKAATQDDLWRHLTEQVVIVAGPTAEQHSYKNLQAHRDGTLNMDMDVKTVMDTWTLQMGFPVITVTRSAR